MHLCASCRRHVKESTCPFCGGREHLPTLGSAAAGSRLSRAQLVAGAALVATVAACGAAQQPQPDPGAAAAVYGAPAAPEEPSAADAGADPQSSAPPPQPSAGPPAPVARPLPTGPTMHPLYGAPPH